MTGRVLILLLPAALLAALLAAGASAWPAEAVSSCVNPSRPTGLLAGIVVRVVDGDTVYVQLRSGRRERVRLLGIDTPELYGRPAPSEVNRALARLARDFTRRHLLGREVGLELDVQTRDAYGRVLAYLWTPDGVLFNMLILREGYAQVLTVPPNVKHADLFLACQREAREQRRGFWGR